jgi:hypothetical protein
MDRAEYLSAVRQFFYQGEVGGEAFASRAIAAETDRVRRYKWGCLLQLETETKARLRPFLVGLGLGIEEADVRAQMDQMFAAWPSKSWREQMEELARGTDFYLGKFREIEAAAPPDEVAVARAMVKHETAINTFARRELAGETSTSVDLMVAELQHPLPAPEAATTA